jgi:hypothetical protein
MIFHARAFRRRKLIVDEIGQAFFDPRMQFGIFLTEHSNLAHSLDDNGRAQVPLASSENRASPNARG